MAMSIKNFTEAFNDASRADKGLTQKHEKQLDALQDIVAAINAEGTFKAELTDWLKSAPGLKITRTADDQSAKFRVGFGFDAFSGSATIVLTSGASHAPVGKEGGYALQYDADKFLKVLGEAVAERLAATRVAGEALKYIAAKTAP